MLDKALETVQAGDTLGAAEMWREVLNIDPTNYKALSNLTQAASDLYHFGNGAEDELRATIKSLIRAYPDSSFGYCELGRLEMSVGNFRKSARAYSKSEHDHAAADREFALLMVRPYRHKKRTKNLEILARDGNVSAIELVTFFDISYLMEIAEKSDDNSDDFFDDLNACTSSISLHILDDRDAVDWLNSHVKKLEDEISQEALLLIGILQIIGLSVILEGQPLLPEDIDALEMEMKEAQIKVQELFSSMEENQFDFFRKEEIGQCIQFVESILSHF